jgi:hypothetical protein
VGLAFSDRNSTHPKKPIQSCAEVRIYLESAAVLRYANIMKTGRLGNASPAKISVLLTPEEAIRFEAYCEQRGHKKSTLIARLVREHLDREQFAMQAETFGGEPSPRKRR